MAWAEDHVINQFQSQFEMDSIVIKTGDKLVFRNNDDYMHNIQIVNGAGEVNDRGLQKRGENIDHTFNTPGHYQVRCSMHRKMRIEVTVK